MLVQSLVLLARTFGAFAALVVCGHVLLRVANLNGSLTPLERFVVASALGTAAIAAELLSWAVLNVSWTPGSLVLPWIALGVWHFAARSLGSSSGPATTSSGPRAPERIDLGYAKWLRPASRVAIACAAALLLLNNVVDPFLSADARAFWTPKAKIFYVQRHNPVVAFTDLWSFFHQDYPLVVPLTEAWVFLWQGGLHEYFMKLVFPVYTLLLCAGIVAFTSRLASATAGWIAGALFLTTPAVLAHGSIAYADLPLALFFWLATALALMWLRTPTSRLVVLSGILAGFAVWIKNEGSPLVLLLGVALTFQVIRLERTRERLTGVLTFWLTFAVVASGWFVVRHNLRAASYLHIPAPSDWSSIVASRLPIIGHDAVAGLFSVDSVLRKWNIVWYVLICLPMLRRRYITDSVVIALTIVAGYGGVIALVNLVTPFDVNWYFVESFDRLLLHIYPLVVFTVASLIVVETDDVTSRAER
jgi:hypothetical protein